MDAMDFEKAHNRLFRRMLARQANKLNNGEVFHAELALVFPEPDGSGKLLAANFPFKTERWLDCGLKNIGTMIEKMTVAINAACNRIQLKRHLVTGFTGIMIIVNASFQPRSLASLSTHAEDMLVGKLIMLDGTSRFAVYRVGDKVTDFPADQEMLPVWELDELWQLLLALDDLQQEMIDEPAEPEDSVMVAVEWEFYMVDADGAVTQMTPDPEPVVMQLPANAQALRSRPDALSNL